MSALGVFDLKELKKVADKELNHSWVSLLNPTCHPRKKVGKTSIFKTGILKLCNEEAGVTDVQLQFFLCLLLC